MPKLYNLHHGKTPQSAVYIGRPSIAGNPYTWLNRGGGVKVATRQESVDAFRVYFEERMKSDPVFKDAIEAMRGHDLCCWCAPLPCHGDVILEHLGRT